VTRSIVALLLLLSGLLIGGAILVADSPEQVTLRDVGGMIVGTATLKAHGVSGVAFELALKGLPPGEHAVHLHETPKCDAPSFESAGPHFNPSGKQHGLHSPTGPHAGDMNNVVVAANGSVKTTLVNTLVTVGPGPDSLHSRGGAAIVIHAQRDDMKSDPAGNAGNRIACGVIPAR
jgi:superoxide dismutase, Cu-Zn family